MKPWIFWDNDGVLVDSEYLYFEATQQALATAGIAYTLQEHVVISLEQGAGLEPIAAQYHLPDDQVGHLRQQRAALYSALLHKHSFHCDEVTEMLRELSSDYHMAIVTSCRKDHFSIIHRSTQILPFMEFVLAREDYEKSKPDPEPYRCALKRAGIAVDRAVVIEDSPRGLQAARAAGLPCIALSSTLIAGHYLHKADAVAASLADLPVLIRELRPPGPV